MLCCFALLIFSVFRPKLKYIHGMHRKNRQTELNGVVYVIVWLWDCAQNETQQSQNKCNHIPWCEEEMERERERETMAEKSRVNNIINNNKTSWQVNTINFVLGWQFKMKCFFSCRIYFVVQLTTNTYPNISWEWSTANTQFTKPQKITFTPHITFRLCVLLQWPASSSLNDAPKKMWRKNKRNHTNVEEFVCYLFNLVTWCGITYIFLKVIETFLCVCVWFGFWCILIKAIKRHCNMELNELSLFHCPLWEIEQMSIWFAVQNGS